MGGVEPTVQMGTLDEILTGTPFDEVLADTTTAIIAERDGGERLVVRLSTRLQAALAAADAERLKDAAIPWAATDEFFGLGDQKELGDRLVELSGGSCRGTSRSSDVLLALRLARESAHV